MRLERVEDERRRLRVRAVVEREDQLGIAGHRRPGGGLRPGAGASARSGRWARRGVWCFAYDAESRRARSRARRVATLTLSRSITRCRSWHSFASMLERLDRLEPPRLPARQHPDPRPLAPLRRTPRREDLDQARRPDRQRAVGNKVRKLEYLMAEAVASSRRRTSSRAAASSATTRARPRWPRRSSGCESVLILRCDDPARPPAPTGNILLDRLVGAEIRWITRPAWRDRNRLLAEEAERIRAAGGRPYIIPEGGSNALGSWGYVRATHELAEDLAGIAAPDHPVTIVYACGSGGTGAGLVLGAKLLGLHGARHPRRRHRRVRRHARTSSTRSARSARDFEERWQLDAHVTAGGHRHRRRPRRPRLREEPARGARDDRRRLPQRRRRPRPGLHGQGVPRRGHRAAPRPEAVRRGGRVHPHRRALRPVRIAINTLVKSAGICHVDPVVPVWLKGRTTACTWAPGMMTKLVALTIALTAATAHAQAPGDTPADAPAIKDSEHRADAVARRHRRVGGADLAGLQGSDNGGLLMAGLASSLVTPSLGEWYAGKPLTAGMGIRAASAVATVWGLAESLKCLDADDSCHSDASAGVLLGAASSATRPARSTTSRPRRARRASTTARTWSRCSRRCCARRREPRRLASESVAPSSKLFPCARWR